MQIGNLHDDYIIAILFFKTKRYNYRDTKRVDAVSFILCLALVVPEVGVSEGFWSLKDSFIETAAFQCIDIGHFIAAVTIFKGNRTLLKSVC